MVKRNMRPTPCPKKHASVSRDGMKDAYKTHERTSDHGDPRWDFDQTLREEPLLADFEDGNERELERDDYVWCVTIRQQSSSLFGDGALDSPWSAFPANEAT